MRRRQLILIFVTPLVAVLLSSVVVSILENGMPISQADYVASLPRSFDDIVGAQLSEFEPAERGDDGQKLYWGYYSDAAIMELGLSTGEKVRVIFHSFHDDRRIRYTLIPFLLYWTASDSIGDFNVAYFESGGMVVNERHFCGGPSIVMESAVRPDRASFAQAFRLSGLKSNHHDLE